MCGFAGFLYTGRNDGIERIISEMTDTLVHRGPDDRGIWIDPQAGVALGHRRLAVLDLSPQGHQPMPSACGRYQIVFNGEIYNHAQIRAELDSSAHTGTVNENHNWHGCSDTEVMLAAIVRWGIETALAKFTGMFAFALWDRQQQTLYLSRDRLGEKPLYYGWHAGLFFFASELKALRAHPAWQTNINRDALAYFLQLNYIPAPFTIYQNIYKLLPGTLLTLNANARMHRYLPEPIPYWSMQNVVQEGMQSELKVSEPEVTAQLHELLKDAVKQQMFADVPLGAFLSGGVDSSLIVALMKAHTDKPVKTFTIGFHDLEYNEAHYAKAVAQHLDTDHTELYISPFEAQKLIPKLPFVYDEPFADASQIPTLLVSQLARQHVTVSLSGDGGDELFGGYNRHTVGEKIWRRSRRLPGFLRMLTANLFTALPPDSWDNIFRQSSVLLPASIKQRTPGDKLHKLAKILRVDTPAQMYQNLISQWDNPASMVLGCSAALADLQDRVFTPKLNTTPQMMMYLDTISYLPDDILTKVDRAAMAMSLETRAPFLDHRVVEFSWRLPISMQIQNGQGKRLLRQILYQYVPQKLIERPKMGFSVPIDDWLRNDLRDWAEALLDESLLKKQGFFDPLPIRVKWAEHLSGQKNWQYQLWSVLMFQLWLEQNAL